MHLSLAAPQIRLRISNAFGSDDLPITAVTVALPFNGSSGTAEIQTQTLKTVTFSGSPNFIIPNGALAVSDPIDMAVEAQSTLTITMYLASGQQSNDITSHPGSRATSFISFGDYTSAANLTDPSTQSVAHWYVLLFSRSFILNLSKLCFQVFHKRC